MKIQANKITDIAVKFSNFMFEDCAESGYDHKAREVAFKEFCAAAEDMKLDIPQAKDLAHIGNANYKYLKEQGDSLVEVEI